MIKFVCYDQFRADLYQKGIDYAAAHAKALGFSAVEFLDSVHSESPVYDHPEAPRFARVLADHGLSVACYSVAADLYPHSPAAEEALKRHARFAAALGSPFFHHTLQSYLRLPADAPTFDEILPTVLNSAEQIARECAALGLTALYEPQGMYFNGMQNLLRFLDAMAERVKNVGICADFGNPMFVGACPPKLMRLLAKHVRHVHIKDYLHTQTEPASRDRYHLADGSWLSDVAVGDGAVDVAACLEALKAVGYDGAFALEFSGSDARFAAAFARIRALWEA